MIITIPQLCKTDYGYYPELLREQIKPGYYFYTKRFPDYDFHKVIFRFKDLLISKKM